MKADKPKYIGGERGQGCLGIVSVVHGSKIEIYFNIKAGLNGTYGGRFALPLYRS